MAARGGKNNLVARRVIDDLIDISGERSPLKYLKIFIEQQIIDHHRFIARMRNEIRTSTNLISKLNALITELEAFGDYKEVFDLVMELRDERRDEQDRVADFNRLIIVAEKKIHGKKIDLEILEAEVGNAVSCFWQDPLVNNENDDLGYQPDEYFDEVHENDEDNHSNGNVVKRGITRVKLATAKMARSKTVYQHTMRRDRKKEIEPDEEPVRGTLWLKGRVNKDGEYPDDEIRSVGDKLVSPVDSNLINSSTDEEGETKIHGCKNDASIQKSNGLATL
nr:hypothetical protein [Tanacetum cinerariifolium]